MYHSISYITLFGALALIVLFSVFNLIPWFKKQAGAGCFSASDTKVGFLTSHRIFYFLFLILICMAAVLRFWRITELPAGMHVDEAGMAYDAYCLSQYGTDRFCSRFPVYLINYDSGQSALYAYLAAIVIKILGNSLLAVRIPAFLSGMCTVIFGGLICKELFGKKWALAGTLLLSICPYYIMASRFGFDCNLFLGFSTIVTYLLLRAVRTRKNYLFLLSGLFIGITLYTYSLSWVAMPLFLLLSVIYLLAFRKINIKQLVLMAVPAFLLALPLFLLLYINMSGKDALVTPFFTVPIIPTFRCDAFHITNIKTNFIYLFKMLFTQDQYIFNSFDEFFTLYRLSIPFAALGLVFAFIRLVKSIVKKKFDLFMLPFFFGLSMVFLGLIITEPDIYRMNSIYVSIMLLIILCLYELIMRLKGQYIMLTSVLVLYLINTFFFVSFYFTSYEKAYPIQWFFNDYIDEIYADLADMNTDKDIYVDNFNCNTYAYDMWIREISPYDFSASNHPDDDDGVSYLKTTYVLPEPGDIREDAIYVVFELNGFKDYLDGQGFTKTQYGYYLLYEHE